MLFNDLHDPRDVLVVKELERSVTLETIILCRTGMENTASVSRSLMVSSGLEVIWLPRQADAVTSFGLILQSNACVHTHTHTPVGS